MGSLSCPIRKLAFSAYQCGKLAISANRRCPQRLHLDTLKLPGATRRKLKDRMEGNRTGSQQHPGPAPISNEKTAPTGTIKRSISEFMTPPIRLPGPQRDQGTLLDLAPRGRP
jgi:hypothetical protein